MRNTPHHLKIVGWITGSVPQLAGRSKRRKSKVMHEWIVTIQRTALNWRAVAICRPGALQRWGLSAPTRAEAREKVAFHFFESELISLEVVR